MPFLTKPLLDKLLEIRCKVTRSTCATAALYSMANAFLESRSNGSLVIKSVSRNEILALIERYGQRCSKQNLHKVLHRLAKFDLVMLTGSLARLSDSLAAKVAEIADKTESG